MKKEILDNLILQKILQYIDEGIHVIDKNGKTIIYNDNMAQLEGLEKAQVINKKLLDIFPSLDEETSTLFTVMKTGRPILNRNQTYLNYKGEKITTVNTTIPIFYSGERIGALEIAKDVTKIKKLSEQLVDLQLELTEKGDNNKNRQTIPKYTFDNIIGNSREIKNAINLARQATKTSSTVLIYGETGTGKELFAQSIHYCGIRKNKPFIAQNCAALPESLLESILFGTIKGSFTGATDKPGLFEQANGGTLLLDEINSMGLTLQTKLLRVLQEGYIRRIGGLKDIPIDVRVIATTNEDPLQAVKKGNLRRDLYYRLNVISIKVPSLRERKEDIGLLCDYFISKYNKRLGKNVWMLSQDVQDNFKRYSWPGNVRELENMIEGAINLIQDDEHVLKKEHFPTFINGENENQIDVSKEINFNNSLPDVISNIEKKLILKALKDTNYNITKAAKLLKIKRQTLQHKIKKYNLK
ncbi:sigma-54 interaction domain-containing protein [Thermohalobacter berrensis]|uniref:Sigma-54-dependent Fis family transcriptional regulator n=1 Tax=Thermohalobacter berrensis TaxID=99594 RepID=A0A419TAZ4_9FIRM|nr:sigma 54-interacting transcriptional regulator [Thermohalobacter berrensis]RKD34635.1 sigma-54-dependent Fis family transcriptional regulator [Thermohalobacter berrensis]